MMNHAKPNWSGARGEKWRANLSGLEAMLAPVDEPLIQALRLETPCRIIDVACGGGGTSLGLLRHGPVGSTVHGIDVSPALIERARQRQASNRLTFLVADAARFVPEALFDRMASRFGVMFFDDPPSAFRNLRDLLKPGGRFAFAVWGPPADNPWMTTVRDVVSELVDLPPSHPDAPGLFRYAGGEELLRLLEDAGFGSLHMDDWLGSLLIGGGLTAEEAARFALSSFASYGELLDDAGDAVLGEARRALTGRFLKHERDGEVRMKARVHIVSGTRAS